MEAQKIPSITCEKCGSFRVMMTSDGPECDDCNKSDPLHEQNLSAEVEYLIYQLTLKENE